MIKTLLSRKMRIAELKKELAELESQEVVRIFIEGDRNIPSEITPIQLLEIADIAMVGEEVIKNRYGSISEALKHKHIEFKF